MKVALVAKIRSGPLLQWRSMLGLTQKKAAEATGVSTNQWSSMECMRFGDVSDTSVAKVAHAIGVDAEEILPPELHRKNMGLSVVEYRDVDTDRLLEFDGRYRTQKLLTVDDPIDLAGLREAMRTALLTLTYREREILRFRFGLDGESPLTLEEVGKVFKVTRDRVRQVEARALRKMQRPVRACKLEGFLDPIDVEAMPV